ncbi:hypothetical protein CALCODRAFT_327949 [Calocera cornea HHB12733]|uniref:Uncharacterized protein n=1 Tax=Calocera cornea HHB12733 TaxID=1353952 RepID=A0A165JHA2_9BASI|nr:hypothetical protein CALCODRAFT_327949 [Calocera cornea HHB12733]
MALSIRSSRVYLDSSSYTLLNIEPQDQVLIGVIAGRTAEQPLKVRQGANLGQCILVDRLAVMVYAPYVSDSEQIANFHVSPHTSPEHCSLQSDGSPWMISSISWQLSHRGLSSILASASTRTSGCRTQCPGPWRLRRLVGKVLRFRACLQMWQVALPAKHRRKGI